MRPESERPESAPWHDSPHREPSRGVWFPMEDSIRTDRNPAGCVAEEDRTDEEDLVHPPGVEPGTC